MFFGTQCIWLVSACYLLVAPVEVYVVMCLTADDAETYTVAEKLFYSAIADFSAMLTADTTPTYDTLLHSLFSSFTTEGNKPFIEQTYNAMRRFARCQWSPLAVPLPFASKYKQRQILGCTRRRQVCSVARAMCYYYGRPLSVSGRQCYILPMFLFIYLFFYGRLILRPWLTEVRENFTRGRP